MNLEKLTIEELESVIATAEKLIRTKEREAKEYRKKYATTMLEVGDVVMVASKKFKDETWEVLKLNPKKVQCKRENGETWNIPYGSIIMA